MRIILPAVKKGQHQYFRRCHYKHGQIRAEVEGRSWPVEHGGAEFAELIGLKSVSKGVKVQFEDGRVVVDIIITVVYGCNIVNVAKAVQDKILSVVQATTGIENAEVNVHVSGIAFDK